MEAGRQKTDRAARQAFAYVDPRGVAAADHDESHVLNALSRFNQVVFENEAAGIGRGPAC